MAIRHVFLWNVTPDADPVFVLNRLNELPDTIPGALSWTSGAHQGEEGNSGALWQYALVADYPSMEALEAYSDHPFHQQVVEELLPFFADRAVCDFALGEAEASN
ncbi:Dabb family protein [Ruicaihuangia caeni]|uniref:Dabb family protein n=1 Tax=Ruicaihuangia caeni TaxID=3042517 RepID=A0AAW6TBH1_9MICO|nr:Dabb family protein [Klugiella sp. YN-L-19]MDI2099370.1 Dabb family protein [Klugiella sp. YN-L-19]